MFIKNTVHIVSLGLAAVLPGIYSEHTFTQQPQSQGSGNFGSAPLTPAERAKQLRISEVQKAAHEAFDQKNYVLAESLWIEASDLDPKNPVDRLNLARLYDLLNRDGDALEMYRFVVEGSPDVASTFQVNPRILSRYGDLCVKFKRIPNAVDAYDRAIDYGAKGFGLNSPRPLPQDRTLAARRAAAHVVSALAWRGNGEFEKAVDDLNIAIESAPKWWLPRYYRADAYSKRVGTKDLAPNEFAAATKLALGRDREFIIGRAKAKGLYKSMGKSGSN